MTSVPPGTNNLAWPDLNPRWLEVEGSALLSRPRWISHAPLNLNSRHFRLAGSDLMAINHPFTLVLVYCPPPSRQNGLTVTQFLQEWEQFLSHRNYSIPTVHWKHQHALWQTGHVQHQTDEEQSSWIRPLTTYKYPKSCSWTWCSQGMTRCTHLRSQSRCLI